jgi:hypothetical protein
MAFPSPRGRISESETSARFGAIRCAPRPWRCFDGFRGDEATCCGVRKSLRAIGAKLSCRPGRPRGPIFPGALNHGSRLSRSTAAAGAAVDRSGLRVSSGSGPCEIARPGSKPAELSPAGRAACPQCRRECRNFVRCSNWESVPAAVYVAAKLGPAAPTRIGTAAGRAGDGDSFSGLPLRAGNECAKARSRERRRGGIAGKSRQLRNVESSPDVGLAALTA